MYLKIFNEFKKSDLDPVKSFKLQDDLNPKVWNRLKIEESVRENLLSIGNDFYSGSDLKADVIDIILCGSLCNYNWSEKYSDYDLHIIINYTDINKDLELVEKLCDLSKKQWNQLHNIKIKGYDVEVAIQDEKDLKHSIDSGRMGGVYSLLNDTWIKRPTKVNFTPDESLISEKGKTIMMEVDDIQEMVKELSYTEVKDRIKKVWEKIKKLRERSLEEEGEFGIGNLVFKLLRRSNYLGKIMKLKQMAYDNQFESKLIKEYNDNSILNLLYEVENLSKQLDRYSSEGDSKYIKWYDLNEDNCTIKVEFGMSGYSDGWSENWSINWGDPEFIVVKTEVEQTSPYGSSEFQKEIKYNSFNELIKEIKENFGI